MTTYRLLKQLGNKKGGVHSDLRKKAEAPAPDSVEIAAPDPVELASLPKRSSFFPHLLIFIVGAGFLGCFWMIFQLANASKIHEVQFQRLMRAMDKQDVALKFIDQKVAAFSAELPKINQDIAALTNKTDVAMAEAAKISELVASQVETLERLKTEAASAAAQTKV